LNYTHYIMCYIYASTTTIIVGSYLSSDSFDAYLVKNFVKFKIVR